MSLKKLTVAGWSNCGAFKQAKAALTGISAIFPSRFSVTVTESNYIILLNNHKSDFILSGDQG
jgi:hypothetical protein